MRAEPDGVVLETRRHSVVLVRPFAKAAVLAAVGVALAVVGWPATVGAVALLGAAAWIALRAVWRWERTRVLVAGGQLVVVHGTLRRRSASVPLAHVGAVELEQSLLGRLLGYGTVLAGDLEVAFVPEPRRLAAVLERRGR